MSRQDARDASRARRFTLVVCFALAVSGCAQVATVSEITPTRSGLITATGEPQARLERYVEAAREAWRRLEADSADAQAHGDYNFAVARIFGTLREAKLAPWTAPITLGACSLEWQPHPLPVWDPRPYEFIPTDQLQFDHADLGELERKDGLGAPLVARRTADPLHDYAPTPHFFYAATGVLRFEDRRCLLSIEDPLEHEEVRVGTRTFPLATDYTSPLAMALVELHPEKLDLPRLLHPADFADTARLARLEPYDPEKTVVLVVHGLMSSPATWFPMLNRLSADEDVRRNYQFWLFSYPTGYPYSYSAAILRRELDRMEAEYPLKHKMVVVGHSMGGCIGRVLMTDSERRIWDQMFTVPPESMDITPEHKHILTESTIFAHRPEIGRVIFISAPLRGADLATNFIGRLGSMLVRLPSELVRTGQEEIRYEKHAVGHKHLDRFPDSIDTLEPDNDFVRALNGVPLAQGIPYHVIVGDRGRGDAPNSSDGVVPYWSSHLPEAWSEKVVPYHHDAHRHPDAIEEVHRILTLHAQSR